MNSWLKTAMDLVLMRSSADLLSKLTEALHRELNLSGVYVLTSTEDGRFFEYAKNEQNLMWLVSDFDNPFAHVIHSGHSMILKNSDLLYWQSNNDFNTLIGHKESLGQVVIMPMLVKGKQLQAILVLQSENDALSEIERNEDFLYVLSVSANHLELLHEIERKKRSSHQLFQTLIEVKEDNKKNHIVDELTGVLIGKSNVMKRLREQVVIAASSHLSVMIQGETGTGKELVSRAVHDLSAHKKAEFVAINCAAIPEHLLESELFGYVKGAFSGADRDKKGLLADANGGTLFLDEIGDMPIALQAKLLRVLESQKYRPVGAEKEQTSKFRLVSATHLNLKEQVLKNKFRKDLYYRLYQYPITLPSLKNRKTDIEQLSEFFIKKYNEEHQYNVRGLHYKALDYLMSYDFPGNVRELKHLIEYGCAQTKDDEQIKISALLPRLEVSINDLPVNAFNDSHEVSQISDLKVAVREYETIIIKSRLREFDGDRAKTAESLGIPKRTLADKCLKLEIVVND